MLGLTRQERGIVAFLVAGLVLGSLVTIYKRDLNPPELPQVDAATVAAFDSISQQLDKEDRAAARRVELGSASRQKTHRVQNGAGQVNKTAPTAPIDINVANEEALIRLPGIGKVTARRIVVYRQQHGRFRRLQDLRKVRGIGPKVLEKIAPLITLSEEP